MEQNLTTSLKQTSAPVVSSLEHTRRRVFWGHLRGLEPYLYLLPAMLVIALWIYRPLIQTVQLAFYQWNLLPTSPRIFVNFENFERLITLPEMGIALRNTLTYTIGILPLSVLLPLGVAIFTDNIGKRARNLYRALIFTPMIIAPVVVSVIWGWILDPTLGIVNAFVKGIFGAPSIRFFSDGNVAIFSIIFVTGWKLTGFTMLIFSAALSNISREYVEAASIDGATRSQIVRHILLPLLSPTVLFMTMLSVLLASQWTFAYINVLTQGGPLNSTTNIYYLLWDYGFRTFAVGWSSAAAVLFLVGFGAIAFFFLRLNQRFSFYDN